MYCGHDHVFHFFCGGVRLVDVFLTCIMKVSLFGFLFLCDVVDVLVTCIMFTIAYIIFFPQ